MAGYRRLIPLVLTAAVVLSAAVLTPVTAAASEASNRSRAAPPPFSCMEQSGGAVSGAPTHVRTVQVHSSHRSDRFVIKLNGPLQQFDVRPQDSAMFFLDPSGIPVTLRGKAGLSVVLHGAQAHDGFRGPTDITPGFPVLLEARQLGDFEGVVSWGLGLSHPACFRVRAKPRSLEVDIQH